MENVIQELAEALAVYIKNAQTDKQNEYTDFDETIARIESRGYVDGFRDGITSTLDCVIQQLNAEDFTEHARIVETYRIEVNRKMGVIEDLSTKIIEGLNL